MRVCGERYLTVAREGSALESLCLAKNRLLRYKRTTEASAHLPCSYISKIDAQALPQETDDARFRDVGR